MTIIDLIPKGHENIINRHDLLALCIANRLLTDNTKHANREMQRLIKKARTECVIISENGKGYYRPTKDEIFETEAWINKENHRAMSNNINTKYARKYLADMKAGRIND